MLPRVSIPIPATWQDLLEEPLGARAVHDAGVRDDPGRRPAEPLSRWPRRRTWPGSGGGPCRFSSRASSGIDGLGLAVARLIVPHLLADGGPITVTFEGTLFSRRRKNVARPGGPMTGPPTRAARRSRSGTPG
jgi:hypothetical protein